ncbi:MAG: peptide deformylase [Desulfobacterales bacterium]
MGTRRQFLKLAAGGLIGTTGIFTFLKHYKQKNNIVGIVEFPNPILRNVSQSIDFIDDDIIHLANSMISILQYHALFAFLLKASLYKGLAAPQIGIQKRMIACGLSGEIKILINPEIVEKRGTYANSEYCLSLPQHDRKMITRSRYVRVKYNSLENNEKIIGAQNSYAALLEHEIDHLNGVLYIDY